VYDEDNMRPVLLTAILLFVVASPLVSANTESSETIITVDSTNLRFSPSTVTIEEGDAVRFFWDGQLLPHNAVEENETFDSGDTKTDEDYTFVFVHGLNGTFEYYCEPHRNLGMVGQIIVNPVNTTENNSSSEGPERMDTGSFMPFISAHAISVSIMLAALIKTRRSDDFTGL